MTDFGFSRAIGPLSFKSDDNTLYKPFSEATARLIDSEAEATVSKAYSRAVTMLTEHQTELHALAEALLEKEVRRPSVLMAAPDAPRDSPHHQPR